MRGKERDADVVDMQRVQVERCAGVKDLRCKKNNERRSARCKKRRDAAGERKDAADLCEVRYAACRLPSAPKKTVTRMPSRQPGAAMRYFAIKNRQRP